MEQEHLQSSLKEKQVQLLAPRARQQEKIAFNLKRLKASSKKCRSLSFCHLRIGGDHFSKTLFQSLSTNTSLRRLSLEYNNINDADCSHLSQALLLNTSMRQLLLENNIITNAGLNKIGEVLSERIVPLAIHLSEDQAWKLVENDKLAVQVRGKWALVCQRSALEALDYVHKIFPICRAAYLRVEVPMALEILWYILEPYLYPIRLNMKWVGKVVDYASREETIGKTRSYYLFQIFGKQWRPLYFWWCYKKRKE